MSDHKVLPKDEYHEVARLQLPHGAGFVLTTVIGAGSMLLGLIVWLLGAGLGWALFAWLLFAWLTANPCALILIYYVTPPSGGTASGRSSFRSASRRYGRALNV
ncbi:hypothetical protein CEW89_09600 [Celeribacter ethanolicus]|uniref:Uncharacterized protein n=1 Tax=Celeribacter ethanolicus TaxID=1758178 RepID=A0A291GC67_9RHOB|nr:hypothetical protein [Celeribacter ethanolicus]ATG47795.1 hypothetical protein CEW89_09600 [Celeribacter ethanolicus]